MKSLYWKLRLEVLRLYLALTGRSVKLPSSAKIGADVRFSKGRDIVIGQHFYCGPGCHFGAPVRVEANVLFGPRVALVGGDHRIDETAAIIMHTGRDVFREISVGEGAWIGYGAIIMHGIAIGKGAVVAAGSVVTKDVDAFAIVGGNPAKHIRYRKGLK